MIPIIKVVSLEHTNNDQDTTITPFSMVERLLRNQSDKTEYSFSLYFNSSINSKDKQISISSIYRKLDRKSEMKRARDEDSKIER